MIVWTENDSCDLAISFQDKLACDELWLKICEVGVCQGRGKVGWGEGGEEEGKGREGRKKRITVEWSLFLPFTFSITSAFLSLSHRLFYHIGFSISIT